ncbi:hypothetical protein AB0451_37160 [Streptomyces sp. NPDC052000]
MGRSVRVAGQAGLGEAVVEADGPLPDLLSAASDHPDVVKS